MPEKTALIKWQLPMRRVLYALAPIAVSGVYFYGWRAAVMLLVVNAAAFLTEYAFTRTWRQPVTSAVFVTGSLLALSLPPALPLWMAAVGAVFAVTFGKMVFGGFGRNIFNPALTGRVFLYVCFGRQMTAQWTGPAAPPLGGLALWAPDAITSATPGMVLKTTPDLPILPLLLGNTAGCIGGTSALLVVAGGLYLLATRTANYRIVVGALAGQLATQSLLWAFGVKGAADPLRVILSGSVLSGIVFYATDPVSACQTQAGRWLYGAFIGILSPLISIFSAWPAGTMFAILLANMFGPITDHALRSLQARPEEKPA